MQLVKWEPQEIDSQHIAAQVINKTAVPAAKLAKHTINGGATVIEYTIVKPVEKVVEITREIDYDKLNNTLWLFTLIFMMLALIILQLTAYLVFK